MHQLKMNFVLVVCLTLAFRIAGLAQPVVSESFSPTVDTPGASITMTFTVSNFGGDAITNLNITDYLPDGIRVSGFGSKNCSSVWTVGLFNGEPGGFKGAAISIASLDPNTTCTFSLPINAPSEGVYNSIATVTFGSMNTVGTPATALLTVRKYSRYLWWFS